MEWAVMKIKLMCMFLGHRNTWRCWYKQLPKPCSMMCKLVKQMQGTEIRFWWSLSGLSLIATGWGAQTCVELGVELQVFLDFWLPGRWVRFESAEMVWAYDQNTQSFLPIEHFSAVSYWKETPGQTVRDRYQHFTPNPGIVLTWPQIRWWSWLDKLIFTQ